MKIANSRWIVFSNWMSVALGVAIGITYLDPMTIRSVRDDVRASRPYAYQLQLPGLTALTFKAGFESRDVDRTIVGTAK